MKNGSNVIRSDGNFVFALLLLRFYTFSNILHFLLAQSIMIGIISK